MRKKKPGAATPGESRNQHSNQNQTGAVNTMKTSTRKSAPLPESFTATLAAAILQEAAHPSRPGGRTITEITTELLEAGEPTC